MDTQHPRSALGQCSNKTGLMGFYVSVMYVLIFIYSVCHPLSSLCMSFCVCPSSSVGGVTVLFFLLLLYLGNISEPNPNFSIFYFLFFCPSPNITWPLPLPCGPIVHCHIPYFHFMFFVTTVIINAEYINNIYVLYFTLSHTFSFVLGNSDSCWIPKSLEVEYAWKQVFSRMTSCRYLHVVYSKHIPSCKYIILSVVTKKHTTCLQNISISVSNA